MSSFRSASILLLLLLSLLLGVTGCGSGNAAPPTAQATTAPTAPLAPTAPPITPAPTLSPAPPWPLKCTPPTASAFPAGAYYVIDATGQFFDTSGTPWGPTVYYADGRVNRTGTPGCFTLAQHQITFTEITTGPHAQCPKAQLTGVYTWAFDGKILSFTLVNDPCSTRSQFFTTYRWEMQP